MAKKQKSLKIGFVFDDTLDSQDGVSQYVKALGKWLTGQGHSVRYLVGETKMRSWAGGKVYSMAKNVRVSFNGNRANIPLPSSRKKARFVLEKEKFDILHVQVPYSPFMAQMVINRAGSSTAVVGTFHVSPGSVWSAKGGHLLKIVYGRSLGHFYKIMSVSPAAALFAKTAFKLSTEISPNVVDVSRFKAARDKNAANSRKVVFLGRLVERKGCHYLLEAFNIVAQNDLKAELIIAGDGPQRQKLERKVKKMEGSIQKRIKFLGRIKEEDKPEILAQAQIACFPSISGESFGIVLIEAMAAGAQVVLGGHNPGYQSVLGAQPDLLANPLNKEEFSARLYSLLNDDKKAQRLHSWQLKEVEKYDVNVVGENLVKLYREAIAKQMANSHN